MDIEKAIDCLKADKEYLTDMKICDGEEMDIAIKALEKLKTMECLLEKAAEEIDIAIKALEKQKELKENCDGNCSDCIYRGDNRCANDLLIDGID